MKKVVFILLFTLIILSCGEDEQNIIKESSKAHYTGITKVDENLVIHHADVDDWRDNGVLAKCLAYPNPTASGVWIAYRLVSGTRVYIVIRNTDTDIIKFMGLGGHGAGYYITKEKAVYWNLHNDSGKRVEPGIYRVFIYAGDFPQRASDWDIENYLTYVASKGYIKGIVYGDVQVK